VFKLEKKLALKYAAQLANFRDLKTFQEKFLALLTDLAYEAESHWDFSDIRYGTVMTKKEWRQFAGHPERKQYRSRAVKFENFEKTFAFIVELLKDAYGFYEKLKEGEYKQSLKTAIASLLDFSLNARYRVETMRFVDTYYGRSAEERDDGIIEPTAVLKAKLDYAIADYCRFTKKDYKKLRRKIYRLCGGRIKTLSEYCDTCQFDDGFRKDLLGVFKVFKKDQTLAFFNVRIGWEVWKIIREIGLNLDAYLELNNMPKFSIIKKKLLNFAQKPNFVNEMLKHMADELPESYKEYKKEGSIETWQWVAEDSRRKKYPKKLRTDGEIKKMVADCQKTVYKYYPLAVKPTPRNLILNPLHPEALTRAFQSSTKNTKGNNISVVVMTPRTLLEYEYLPVLAHEATHAVHRIVLEAAEGKGVLPKGSAKRISNGALEEFSQLVEHLFYKSKSIPKKKFIGKEFPNFYSGVVIRHQAPYAFCQLSLRKEFDKLYDSGFRGDLTDDYLWKLKFKYDKKAKYWHQLGLKIINDQVTAFGLFSSYAPDDGLIYMKRYLLEKSQISNLKSQNDKVLTMAEAFKKRFGKDWIKRKEARAVLLWMFLESGRNHKIETFGKLVLNKKPEDCLKELKKIGIKSADI